MNRSRKRRDLARAISQRKRAIKWQAMNQALAYQRRVLDDLDAFGMLDRFQRQPPDHLLCFGPKAVSSPPGSDDPWAGVVVWYRPSGYHNYQQLTLLGIWVQGKESSPQIMLGTRVLRYSGQPYNPESYFHQLQRDFSVYYQDAPNPPDVTHCWMVADYTSERRIELRQQIAVVVKDWERMGHE